MGKSLDRRLIDYHFTLESGETISFRVKIDKHTLLNHLSQTSGDYPEWTRLDYQQCPNCPLKADQVTYCPLSTAIHRSVERFNGLKTSGIAKVRITAPERSYAKRCVLQEGLASLFGLVMGTSACPHFDFLRPLAKHHIPFASTEETLVRVVGSNFTAHYFKEESTFAEAIAYLAGKYKAIQEVNKAMLERISSVSTENASRNAVIDLNSFTQMFDIEYRDNLGSLYELHAYLGTAGDNRGKKGP